ncbi:SAM-dependent methyltransferase [Paenibacillus terrigena]|uniref:class I SAM-dependent methyltransferase n=1 Tax=Paenibacillus terrigena TaxID=369333 RepID=UPI0028D0826C|nr:SAM-dependent methyltransferase [Paenibacillus terrigena]
MLANESYTIESLGEMLNGLVQEGKLVSGTMSQLRHKLPDTYTKVLLKTIELRKQLYVQFEYHYAKRVTHENVPLEEAGAKLAELFEYTFRQGLLRTTSEELQVLLSKKNKVTVIRKKTAAVAADLTHNRKKQYVLEEGEPVPFLIELGIMNGEGKVLAKKYDKFRQINRFLEMIQDVLPHLPKDRTITIVDFGCGKSYLTFAMYHYLQVQQGLSLNVVGLDLKADVIAHCQQLAERLDYGQLQFLVGDIAEYNELEQVDMVVTLHACDTATDAALEKAVRWGANVILSVPCCQHELFRQIDNPALEPLLSHGILKERFSALATDAARAKLLDLLGYRTQLLEFIDMEHTPKNILIRAVKGSAAAEQREQWVQEYVQYRDFLHISPYLERACQDFLPPLTRK